MRGDYAESYFMLVAPRHNHLVQNSAALYSAFLAEPTETSTRFVNIELEQVIEAYGWAGEQTFATALYERYANWWKIDEVVRSAIDARDQGWFVMPSGQSTTVALIGKAA